MSNIRKSQIYICVFVCLVTQLCPALCDPMDCGPPGFSVRGILQARILETLEWVAISYSRGSSWLRNRTQVSCVSCIGRHILYHCAIWEVPYIRIYTLYIYIIYIHTVHGVTKGKIQLSGWTGLIYIYICIYTYKHRESGGESRYV